MEMRARVDLWERGQFVPLLERIEDQLRLARTSGQTTRRRGAQARAMARRGAYRKAVQSFGTAPAELSSEQQLSWAKSLLPESIRPPQLTEPLPLAPAEAERQDGLKALDGVHFSRLSAPGRSGMRPEHLRDMLA